MEFLTNCLHLEHNVIFVWQSLYEASRREIFVFLKRKITITIGRIDSNRWIAKQHNKYTRNYKDPSRAVSPVTRIS